MSIMKAQACFLLILVCLWQTALCRNVVHMSQEAAELTERKDEPAHSEKALREFSFASYYGDHMVLQRAPQRAIVWGYHPDPGNRIIVQVKGRRIYSAIVDETGVWKVLLDPESSAGPFQIVALSESKAIHLNDVLFGDVWLCSGQSNMLFTLDKALNGTEEIKAARNFQDIRVFTPQRQYSKQPLSDLVSVMEKWSHPKKATLSHEGQYFSAICWLYGKHLYQQLGYPIGLIDTTWGGTPIESWMSARALKKCGMKPQGTETPSTYVSEWSNSRSGEGRNEGSPVGTEQDHAELWNAMINPFASMTLYGVIWDQGENDALIPSYRDKYNCTFPAMIDDWRETFSAGSGGQTSRHFPFGFVQIGAFLPDSVVSVGFPDVRWHQTADYGYVPNPRMKNVFMSVTMDITDFNSPYGSVHTRDKEDIAYRLFLGGLSVAYNISAFWQGPLPISVTLLADTLVLDYGRTWTLELRQREGFELCCSLAGGQSCQPAEGKAWWVPTSVVTANATHVQLYAGVCGEGQRILGLRYAWRMSPCPFKQCAVYSKENALPAPPFVACPGDLSSGDRFFIDWTKPVHL